MSETRKPKQLKGMVEIEITSPEKLEQRSNSGGKITSSYKKGDKVVYHCSVAQKLVDQGVAKVVREIKEWVHPAMKK